MNFFYRAAAVCLCAVLLCGCAPAAAIPSSDDEPQTAEPQQEDSLAVGWLTGNANPYRSDSLLTAQLAQLLFEPMVRITPDLEPEYRLAQAVSVSGCTAAIQLRAGCFFADGAPVTAEDLAASLLAAKASRMYGARFAAVQTVEVKDSAHVLVTLDAPDSLFAYLLDIPVLRADEVGLDLPTPCGRYLFAPDGESLVPNPKAPFAEAGPTVIRLTPVAGYTDLVSGLAIGKLDLYTAANENTAPTFASTGLPYKTNTMIFAGVNSYSGNPLCGTAAGRRALSALLDRRTLAVQCCEVPAYPAAGILNSFYPCVRGQQVLSTAPDEALAEELLAQLGYTKDENGQYMSGRSPAAVRILTDTANSCHSGTARALAEKWTAAGLKTEVITVQTFDQLVSAVQNRQFELYIGEMKLYNNMDISAFWQYGLGLTAGDDVNAACSAFRLDASAAPQLEAAFAAEMPFIPLLWENGIVIADRTAGNVVPSLSGPFYSFGRE